LGFRELKNAATRSTTAIFSDHYSQEDKRPEVQEFLKKYQAEFGKTPDSMAALGYDAANLLFDAMTRAPSLNGKDLAKAIASTKDFKASPEHHAQRQARRVEAGGDPEDQGGKFSYFATVEPPK
jgi:branched-chain amino acid transport system substrate-binding protein